MFLSINYIKNVTLKKSSYFSRTKEKIKHNNPKGNWNCLRYYERIINTYNNVYSPTGITYYPRIESIWGLSRKVSVTTKPSDGTLPIGNL